MQSPLWLRGALWTCGIILAVVFAFLVWAIDVTHSPGLMPAEAGALISARPEFNQYAKLVEVSSTTRYGGSLKDCCYWADFRFLQFGSNAVIPAHAEFRYSNGAWHLQMFSYGKPPHTESIWVGQDDPSAKK